MPFAPAGRAVAASAILLGPLLALAIYVVLAVLLLIVFTLLPGDLTRDRIVSVIVFFTVYTLPSIAAPFAGSLLTGMFLGGAARRAAYWPILLLLIAFTAMFVLWSALSGGTGFVVGLLQLASSALAWHLLNQSTKIRGQTSVSAMRPVSPSLISDI
jgi:hypothetical protein